MSYMHFMRISLSCLVFQEKPVKAYIFVKCRASFIEWIDLLNPSWNWLNYNMAEYDLFASSFARTRKKHWPDIDELISMIPSEIFSGRIWDIGCGSGRFIEYVPNFSKDRYIGIDISSGMVQVARESYVGVDFRVLWMGEMRQLWHMFDGMFFIASLQHICSHSEQYEILESAFSQIKSDWYIWLLNWNLLSEQSLQKYPPNEPHSPVRHIPFQWNLRTYFAIDPEILRNQLESIWFVNVTSVVSTTGLNFLTIGRKL
jgi:SAM-dependent methyltransferase